MDPAVFRVVNRNHHRMRLTDLFAAEGFRLTFARERGEFGYYAFLKWVGRGDNPIGTALETLLLVVEGNATLHRDILAAEEIIEEQSGRLNPFVAIVFGVSSDTDELCREASTTSRTHFIGGNLTRVSDLAADGATTVLTWLRDSLYGVDLYANTTAVANSTEFFGRRAHITQLATTLQKGSSHVGLFGLRKVGKTSLLLRTLNILDEATRAITAHVDAEHADSIDPTTDFLLWQIGESLFERNRSVRRTDSLDLFGRYDAVYRIPEHLPLRGAFAHDIKAILERAKSKTIVIAIDEVQFMADERWDSSFVEVWRILRSIDQESPGRLSFLVSGTDPTVVTKGRISGQENPVFRYFRLVPVAPLEPEESHELVKGIGRRMGLDWEDEAVGFCHAVTGGHPGLLRQFCSQVHVGLSPRNRAVTVRLDAVKSRIEHFLRAAGPVFRELDEHLKTFHPSSHEMLLSLAKGDLGDWSDYCRAFPDEHEALVDFGLVRHRDDGGDQISVMAYQSWLQKNLDNRDDGSIKPPLRRLAAGDAIGGYRIERSIGRAGGYARVFEADDGQGSLVALKVMTDVDDLRFSREVEILRSLVCDGVVKVVDHGRSGSYSYLAMELLEGESWSAYLNVLQRRDAEWVKRAATKLLETLVELHPPFVGGNDEARLEARLQTGSGIIHRDIKPDNIIQVPGRGPVLIDFNIASRSDSTQLTTTATPGYLPTDLAARGRWSPAVDLYGLGLTLVQILTGVEFRGDNLSDIMIAAEQHASARLLTLCAGLLRLSDTPFEYATEALNSLSDARL